MFHGKSGNLGQSYNTLGVSQPKTTCQVYMLLIPQDSTLILRVKLFGLKSNIIVGLDSNIIIQPPSKWEEVFLWGTDSAVWYSSASSEFSLMLELLGWETPVFPPPPLWTLCCQCSLSVLSSIVLSRCLLCLERIMRCMPLALCKLSVYLDLTKEVSNFQKSWSAE